MKKNYKKQILTSEEWHIARLDTIGGSEAAAVLNKSKWATPADIYNKMVLHKEKKVANNERMQDGTNAESHIRALYAIMDKRFLITNPPTYKHWYFTRKDKPYLACTPDGLARKGKELWGLEVKDVEIRNEADKNAWEGDLLPDQYYHQVLQYLVVINDMVGVILIANLHYFKHDEETDSWVFDKSVIKPYFIYRIDVNAHVNWQEKKLTDFYEINIKGRKRPKIAIKF